MSDDINPRVTYVRDPDLVPPLTPVFVVNGSIVVNINPADIEIGAIEIKDASSDTRVKVHAANGGNTPSDNVLLVQSVDQNGEVILRDDIQNIDAGMDILISGQIQSNDVQTNIMNNQGTLATSSRQDAGNLILVGILNNQGSQATSAYQTTEIAAIQSVDSHIQAQTTAIQTGSVIPAFYTIFDQHVGPGYSTIATVTGRFHHTVHHDISGGSIVVETQSSINGQLWHAEAVTQRPRTHLYEEVTNYIRARVLTGNGTITSYVMSI